ncbi:MAG: dTMP kinase [Idiomarina sp.]|nr:dTMP kinase [Idiomarina sp.]
MTAPFIVVEGLEGAGKSTVMTVIANWLAQRGTDYIQVREPGGTPFAEALRDIVKGHWDEKVSAEAELMLMYAARVQLVREVIQPALAHGQWVLGDRHDLSSRAYQGGGRQLPDSVFTTLRALTLGEFRPNLTIYLDIDPAVGLERARSRGALDRIEQEQISFFTRTRARYLEIANSEPNIQTIEADQPPDKVRDDVIRLLEKLWPLA